MKSIHIIYTILLGFSSLLAAQSQLNSFQLLDGQTRAPIQAATFIYGDQKGISDDFGMIRLQWEPEAKMYLSHVTYGDWVLNSSALQKAIENGEYLREESIQTLYPATIIALQTQSAQPESKVNIQYPDRMQHDAASILNQTPAFNSIRKGGAYGFDPVFRGFKYDQLNIVLNGAQSATAACPNRMDPPTSQMAPNMMDRIEILKGPHALRFGTGLGATINFIPAALRFSAEPNVYGRVSGGYEHNGEVLRAESQIGLSGAHYDLSLFASWSQGDDYQAGNGQSIPAGFERGSFGTQLGLRLSERQELRVTAMYNRARDADFPALPMDLRDDDTWMFNARHDIQFEGPFLKSWNTTVFASFVDHLMDNLLKPLDPRILNASTAATTQNYGARTEGEWQFGDHKLYAGADFRAEGAQGIRTREFLMGPIAGNVVQDNAWQEGLIQKTGVFGEYRIKGNALDYVLSGRVELNTARIDKPTDEFTRVYDETEITQFNPSLSVGVLKEFNNRTQLGLWLGRAQRSGSLTERFINYFPVGLDPFELIGNPQLRPEVNYQADLNLKVSMGEKSSIDVDVFAAYLEDYISSFIDTTLTPRMPMSPGVRRFENIDQAFKAGVEVNWNQALWVGLAQRLGIAYTYGQDLDRAQPLPEIAPLDVRYTLYGNYWNSRVQPELSVRYVSDQSRISPEFGETRTPSFVLLDLKLAFQVTEGFSFDFGVQNLLDELYYEHLNRSVRGSGNPIFAPGRNFFMHVNYTF